MSSMPTLKPRLVCLHKPVGCNSFGFNVTATRSETCRYVGIVVDNSLAKQCGLRSGDRIHEVNGVCVDGSPLADIQGRIASGGVDVQLLVADPMTDQLYRDNHEIIRGGLPETIVIRSTDHQQYKQPTPPPTPPMYKPDLEEQEMEAEVVDADEFLSSHTAIINVEDDHQPNGDTGISSSPFKARLCKIKRWSDYPGYGFVLHGDKEDPGQNIGKVEAGSPSEAAGLRQGDRLIEVNGINVEGEFQQTVVNKISSGAVPGEVTLLVVDPDALRFFRGHGISVHSSMVDIERIETPPRGLVPVRDPTAKVRLCHVKKWPDFEGYGFVLHGERGVPGTTLSNVDPGSPAEAAGLRDGDKIIEINGVNVEGEEQPHAISRIQMGVDGDISQTRLLVVDSTSELYFKRQNIFISGSMADVVYMTNPERTPYQPYQPYVPDPEPTEETDLPPPMVDDGSSDPRSRLCRIKRWSTFDGYGFYLHSEEGVPGMFIGKVDADSPAEAAGVRRGDRIIEVNEQNVEDDSQDDVAKKVLSVPNETQLLLVDDSAYRYFLGHGILVNSHMQQLDVMESPER